MAILTDFYGKIPKYDDNTFEYDIKSTTLLDFSGSTAGSPCFVDIYMNAYIRDLITAGAADAKVFDSRHCTITRTESYDSVTGVPTTYNFYAGGHPNLKWIDLSHCGRIYTNIDDIIPVDNITTIDIIVPNHGIPLNTENLSSGYIKMGVSDYGTSGILSSVDNLPINAIIDENTLRLGITLEFWNLSKSNAAGQNLYIDNPIIHNVGGQNFTGNRLDIHWKFDRNDPYFLESIFCDY